MEKLLTITSTAMILGALTGGTILGAIGGKGLNSIYAGAIMGSTSAVVANTLSSLIKTDRNITACLKTTISIPISAAFTLFAFAYILDAKSPNVPSGTDPGWRYLAYMVIGAINVIAATTGVAGAAISNGFCKWLFAPKDSSAYEVSKEASKEIDVNKLKLN